MIDQSLQRLSQQFEDIDLLTEALSDWDASFLPLTSSGNNHTIDILASPTIMVQQFRMGQRLHQKAATPRATVTFGLPTGNTAGMDFNNQIINQALVVFASGQEYTSVSPAGFLANAISIEKDTLAEIAERYKICIDIETLGTTALVLALTQEDIVEFGRLLTTALNPHPTCLITHQKIMERELPLKLLSIVATSKNKHRPTTRASYQSLIRARTYIDSNFIHPIKLSDICKASHANERMLERAFKDYFDLTPSEYLRQVRLNHAWKALKNNEAATPIAQIASYCGFSHLGRFAGYYRKQYGESPSDTAGKYKSNTDL